LIGEGPRGAEVAVRYWPPFDCSSSVRAICNADNKISIGLDWIRSFNSRWLAHRAPACVAAGLREGLRNGEGIRSCDCSFAGGLGLAAGHLSGKCSGERCCCRREPGARGGWGVGQTSQWCSVAVDGESDFYQFRFYLPSLFRALWLCSGAVPVLCNN
jgi:hypothetical protein